MQGCVYWKGKRNKRWSPSSKQNFGQPTKYVALHGWKIWQRIKLGNLPIDVLVRGATIAQTEVTNRITVCGISYGASPNYFAEDNVIVTLRGGGGKDRDVIETLC